ncbi:hypothetical protein DJ568_10110 [Mucilaginibacter hurinus]|uniref:LPXTG cell wall anchor domain-containing protein n=1 Tax=Mucilaginibacter hurinus TaxID=2201324 RepID=A0A367GPP2_9SPHI|nr:hypothetical protein [Mucilaginibacter hurinus]RCH54826.1 hypothetical protein DJ568_10110 [Mucilaginibacter hurinus]
MTRAFKIIFFILLLGLTIGVYVPARSQCAQCAATVESNNQSGDNKTAGINNGILYLLAMPYIAVALAGFIWYKKYRRKNVALNMRDEKLNLN